MSEVLHKRVELAANVSIVLVSLLIGFTLIRDKFLNRPQPNPESRASVNPNRPTPNIPRAPEPGQKVSLPDVDWGRSKQTLLLVVSKGCHFCTESAGFYQRLARESAGRTGLRLVAVLPQDVETGRGYLSDLGVPISEVVQARPDAVGVRGTPTLLLVDSEGTVKNVWVGKLPGSKQDEVLRRLKEVS